MAKRTHVAVLAALVVAFAAFAVMGRADEPTHDSLVTLAARGRPEPLVLVFVDSLSDRVARDPSVMPTLAALARGGVSLEVEPCRDRLTYLCLRALLTGRDDASVLAFMHNFDRSESHARADLFSEVAARGDRIAVAGTDDFRPYARSFAQAHFLTPSDEAHLIDELPPLSGPSAARLTVIGVGQGDRAAHAFGTDAPEYRAAFRAIDDLVAEIRHRTPAGAHLVVFGDHGHDAEGRHLPGGSATTWAVYTGPAFLRGLHARVGIIDERALLGVALGVPTPRSWSGPRLASVLDPAWVSARYGVLPELTASEHHAPPTGPRALLLAAVAIFGVLAGRVLLGSTGLALPLAARTKALLAAGLVALAAGTGLGFDAVRRVIHDHGDTPARSLLLLLPFGSGFVAARFLGARATWVPRGAAISALVTLLTLLPSANYYGSSRAVPYAAMLCIGAVVAAAWRGGQTSRPTLAALAVIAVAALASFYDVRREAGEGVEVTSYVMKAPLYAAGAWLPTLLAPIALLAIAFAALPRGRWRNLDLALSAALLVVGAATSQTALVGSKAFGASALVLVAGALVLRARLPLALIAAGLLLLGHFYPAPIHRAPIEVLLAGTGATLLVWRRALPSAAQGLACVLTLAAGGYLMLWPVLGFRFSGVDFRFAFAWVRVEEYERFWWVIACLALVKTAWPFVLLVRVARLTGAAPDASARAAALLGLKALLVATLCAGFAVVHSMGSTLALEMLAELALVAFAAAFLLPQALTGRARGAETHQYPATPAHERTPQRLLPLVRE